MIPTILSLIILVLGARTLLWHLQNWQIREYSLGRMRARLRTNDGKKDLYSFWFFRGILPRPKISKRIMLIGIIFGSLSILDLFLYTESIQGLYYLLRGYVSEIWVLPITLLVWERFIWLYVAVGVWLTGIITNYKKRQLFRSAKKIINQSDTNIVRIGITGSYGKSSTKEVLVHLLQDHFGAENILFTPENNNHEIALARLILKRKKFFTSPLSKISATGAKKIAIFEMGAYRRGEIKTMCEFVQPHISILTAIGQQHLDLFGSQKNIQLGKFEIAEGASDKVFFNADNDLCNEIFARTSKSPMTRGDLEGFLSITATTIGIKSSSIKKKSAPTQTEFHAFGEDFVLPWPGEFFVGNAMLALECARELGAKPKNLAASLSKLPPLERAMQISTHPTQKFTIIKDLYSANPAGVKAAIEHLKKFSGTKIFVGHPLLELGNEAEKIHAQIFHKLFDIKAQVFWIKDDYQSLGQKICSDNWQGSNKEKLKKIMKNLGKNDVILFEGRLPEEVIALFEHLAPHQ